MEKAIAFTLNGENQTVETEPERTLLEVLRENLGMTGTKYGCGEGHCRACTVLIDGRPESSCQVDMADVAGHRVETIEGVALGEELHPVQAAFLEEDAMQCGYCVPGMIMATIGVMRMRPLASKEEFVEALQGNLCRCCGYGNIVKALDRIARANREVAP